MLTLIFVLWPLAGIIAFYVLAVLDSGEITVEDMVYYGLLGCVFGPIILLLLLLYYYGDTVVYRRKRK